jgi:hypothetical protein
MADTRRNQEHLGIDTNVLVAYVDAGHPSHAETGPLAGRGVALNPTIIHEGYHTLAFKLKWAAGGGSIADTYLPLPAWTSRTSSSPDAQDDPSRPEDRDRAPRAWRAGCADPGNLLVGKVAELVTYDKDLLALGKVRFGRSVLLIRRP